MNFWTQPENMTFNSPSSSSESYVYEPATRHKRPNSSGNLSHKHIRSYSGDNRLVQPFGLPISLWVICCSRQMCSLWKAYSISNDPISNCYPLFVHRYVRCSYGMIQWFIHVDNTIHRVVLDVFTELVNFESNPSYPEWTDSSLLIRAVVQGSS